MKKEAIDREVVRAGWDLDHGFSGHMIIGNAGNLSILALSQASRQGVAPEYELYDSQRNLVCPVGLIPTPRRAGMLLEEHGEDVFVDE